MRITCEKHPNLLITEPRVRFVDGVADVDEADLAKLEPLIMNFGIAIEGEARGRHADGSGDAPASRRRRRRDSDG